MQLYSSTLLKQPIVIDRMIMVHYFEYSADLSYMGESHNFWEFVYVMDGCVKIEADGVPHILNTGEVLFHQPNEFHTISSHKGSCPKLIIISFVSESRALDAFRKKQMSVTFEESKLLLNLLKEAETAFSTPLHIPMEHAYLTPRPDAAFGSEQMVDLYLRQFLIRLFRRINPHSQQTSTDLLLNIQLPHSDNPRIDETLQFLVQHLSEPLQIKDICRSIGIGRSRLQQLFSAELGCGIIEYFLRLKATAAKQLLLQQDMNIIEIANFLGFSSPSHFTFFFKKYFGCTPSQYRKAALDITKSVLSLT